jgi:putative RNA-binding protein, YhbY family
MLKFVDVENKKLRLRGENMLNNKQKKYLKKEAHSLKAIYQIGKDGISANLLLGLSEALENHELMKVKILESCPTNKYELAIEISANCKCEIVEIIGGTIILYKSSKKRVYKLPS